MIQKVLAPSDGSEESEKALPLAEQIARANDAELVLVCVIDNPGFPARPGATDEAIEKEAAAHMAETEARIRAGGTRVRAILERGPAAAMLLDREAAEAPDLVVMATHGRSGLARFALGSVTDRMVREGSAPVLIVRRSTPASTRLENALVMLDGSGFGEGALALARSLAGAPLRAVTLFRAVADPRDRSAAQTYLDGAAGSLKGSGVETRTAIDVGDPRFVTERAAKGHDLVILATHG